MINTEELKRVAEFMGYKVKAQQLPFGILCKGNPSCLGNFTYNPPTHAEQLLELIEKNKINIEYSDKHERWETYINPASEYWYADSLAEAVILAVLALIGEE